MQALLNCIAHACMLCSPVLLTWCVKIALALQTLTLPVLVLLRGACAGIQIGLLFVWGNAMIALSLLLSCFFTSTRTATVFCYMFVFATGLIGYLLMRALLDLQGYVFWIEALQVLPPLALYRCAALASVWGGARPMPVQPEHTKDCAVHCSWQSQGKSWLLQGLS